MVMKLLKAGFILFNIAFDGFILQKYGFIA